MKTNRILLSLACLGMAFGLASCSNTSSETSTSSSSASSQSSSSTSQTVSSSSPLTNPDLQTLDFSVICPQGAPAASLARYAESSKLLLAGAQQVRAAFSSAENDFIIFDSVNGIKLAGENYKLVRMVTFGNLYVVSTGNDENGVLEDSDTIYSYGEGLVPDLAFKKVYPEITPDFYGADVSTTAPVMTSGKFEGQDIDYVVSSYPPIFAAMNQNKSLSVYANVAEKFGEEFHTDGFPQAGLFIKSSLEADGSKKDAIEKFLAQFDFDVQDLAENQADQAVSFLTEYGDAAKQAERFGFNANVLKGVQKTNGLAFLTVDKNPSLEGYSVFEETLGYKLTESLLSSFYPTK